jgi:hypothetical protein
MKHKILYFPSSQKVHVQQKSFQILNFQFRVRLRIMEEKMPNPVEISNDIFGDEDSKSSTASELLGLPTELVEEEAKVKVHNDEEFKLESKRAR